MLEAAILGGLLKVAFDGIVGSQANDALKHLCLKGVNKLSRNGKIVNHDLEKALKRSFLKAQQQIASECYKELVEPSRRASRGIVIYLPQDRPYLEWLDKKIKQLKSELKQVNKETAPSGIPIEGLDEIELLLSSRHDLSPNRFQEVENKLLQIALKDCDVTLYQAKLKENLFSLVSAYFAEEIKDNEKVFPIFTAQSLTRNDTQTAETHALMEQLKALLEEIVENSRLAYRPIDWQAICQQILEEKEQQRLSSNQLTFGNHQIDDVYVPLGLVELQKVTQRGEDVAAEEGSDLYREKEVTQKFEHSKFLEQVIQQGSSPKSNGKRLGIIGEPGAGKTTLLRQIANWVVAGISEAIVIWVSLADLQGKELEPYLFDNWLLAAIKRIGKAEATAEIKDDFLAQFNAERVWLVLDGADEMAVGDGNPLAEIQRQIRTGGCIQKARIVLSCRQNVWDAIGTALDTFDTYRTLEFSYPEQVEMFIDKWFRSPPNPPLRSGGTREDGDGQQEGETLTPPLLRGAGGDLSQQLREALAASGKERIRDLVKNPLRCSLLCGTWQSLDGDLPDTKAKLYRRFVTTLYQWKQPRLNWIQQQELNAALGKLALSGMLNETSRFQLRESVGYRVMGASQFELACRLGWLNLVARDAETLEGIYAFYHPTFQEYFAALAVEDWHFFLNHIPPEGGHGGTAPTGVYRIFEKQWKEVILLWLGREEVGKEEKEAFIQALVEFEDGCGEFYGYRAYFLAAAGIAEFKDCSFADEIVSQVIKWGFGYFDEEKQEWQTFPYPLLQGSRDILKETDRAIAISDLVEFIGNSQDEYAGSNAAESLGQIGKDNPVAIAALADFIRNCGDEDTQHKAVYILGRIGKYNRVASATLVELIRNSDDEYTRSQAAYVLGIIDENNPEGTPDLVALIRHLDNENTGIGEINQDSPEAIADLVELIRTSDNEDTWRGAAERLGEIGKYNPEALAALTELIRNCDDENTQYRAADSLGKIDKDNPVAIAALVKLIRSSGNGSTQLEAVYSLGQIGKDNPVAIAALVELIRNLGDEIVRRGLVAYSLGKIDKDNPLALSSLIELIRNSDDENIRWLAAESLGRISKDNPVVIEALVELINTSQDENTRRQAAESLGTISKDNPVAIAALVELINSSQNESTRRQTAYSLGKIDKDNPVAIASLVELTRNSGDEDTRRQAADSLGEIGKDNQVAIAGLVELIRNSGDDDTRWRAVDSLREIGKDNQVAIAGLVELIRNSGDEETRRLATYMLGKIMKGKHFATAVSGLKDCLTSEISENDFNRYKECYQIIWDCAQNMTYPEFYQAWHTQPTNSPTPDNHPQNTDIPTLLKQLQPTDKTWVVPLNIRALEGETDTSAIAQELCTQLYQAIFPADTDIPAIRNAPEFKRLIPQLKNRLQKQHIALILHSCPCEDALSSFTRKLADVQMGIHIAWITDTPLELPLTGFRVDGDDLLNAVQNWIGRI
ncbi:HEAT repeat domain-containing protein [Microcoleus sp. T3_B1]|uniref:HEAT repeat domain-containing protein n=1 Tax=Microcoleus sp. T3_B1 TaxID=3055425 RepID=UPI002FD0F9A8